MTDYSLGKIYKITGNGLVYIGSTCRTLAHRLSRHKSNYKEYLQGKYGNVTSFECVSDPNCSIELLEAYPCHSKTELHRREGKWILETECVNKLVAGRTIKECGKIYYEKNRQQIAEKYKIYYENNKQELAVKHNEYRVNNKQEIKEKDKIYYEKNKQEIKEKGKAYREANKQELNEKKRAYYLKNKK